MSVKSDSPKSLAEILGLEVSPTRDRDISTGNLRSCQVSSIVGGFRSGFSGRRKAGGGAEEGRRIIKNSGRRKGGGGAEEGRNH